MASIAMWIFQKVISIKLNYIHYSKSIHVLYIHIFIVYHIYLLLRIHLLFGTSWILHVLGKWLDNDRRPEETHSPLEAAIELGSNSILLDLKPWNIHYGKIHSWTLEMTNF